LGEIALQGLHLLEKGLQTISGDTGVGQGHSHAPHQHHPPYMLFVVLHSCCGVRYSRGFPVN
jgi:hypothetical protein